MSKRKSKNLTDTQIWVIKEMADNRLCRSAVGRNMYRSHVNILYHCEQIKRITGLDPRDFWDMKKLVDMIGYERGVNDA